jgi:thioester reductase-like protein
MREVLIEDFKQLTERNIPWNELRDKTFLITGATGLIGSLLVRCLLYANETINLNAKVYAVVRNTDKADRIFEDEKILLEWEAKQNEITEKENAMLQKTKVNFHSMDSEVTV